MFKQEKIDRLTGVIDKYCHQEGSLMTILQRAQEIFNYLPEEALSMIGKKLKIPLSKIYGVVTFYSAFHLTPHGKYSIIACRGTGCQVKGSKKILHTIKETIGINEGETREDLMFSLDTVSCLGACALAPVVVINKDYFGKMTPEKVKTIFGQYEK
ncbi:NAD(P)H-dependent oxidoreductase subunit E [Candidatus Desantisbacteria bacterium CG2_30_40_21]|uniref:NAD(P)H-dependent oxidoreductase subunit E n=4 Tax=unclassified Candidatus Desantisiibacteriota TaxID=3106372 RepID=A0A2M7P2G9_9BACT|nr:MAG: NAD(P)H-dependent oxidoreductase subunit E [Candidatus Desantisbacteria bacterium CG2_30_40_21]PIP41339.1 MAG: NAD(P)H-dependent oxidoreductase subunit E [Candidatus Desantisbacteria bacterium CG23_combo_of_CG06-09_8_20_14_all_40_23]PIY19790.1 MAG: NAD(P)H-dependent oxidoreductase subunit E [Candidatus Desantisbacteria bacterium CG_4_10_14_3_um_filter_40_18]PJB28181.1 MAG: NAD(P)H-dependent oxidoreductase subunit E [Candidatus Desantisbacteria bacterium CG_4_9_14_3_um_filter_40_11]